MGILKTVKVGLMDLDCILKLLDVLSSTFSERSLGLSVALFALL